MGGQPLTTTYNYDAAGSLTNTVYSDTTPGVTSLYDRLGRLSAVVCDGMTDTMTYNLAGEPLVESFSGGALDGLSVTNGYDNFLRRTNLSILNSPSSILASTAYGYDAASRLQTVADGNGNSAAYSYVANSPLVSQITFQQSGATRMTTTKQYDDLNRLTQIASAPSGTGVPPVSFNYNYNAANQRTKNTLADGSYWVYQYDPLGQVTGGTKHFADGTLVPGQQFGYQFDDIGNREQTTAGGDAVGASLRLANYSVNTLNQITSRDYPGTNDVIGAALATNSVTVNGQTAWRKGEYFWATVKTNNTSSAQWLGVTVASGGTTNTGHLFVPKTPEQFSYDADGNLTNDGRWSYVWDAENRLIQMTVNTNVGPQYQLTFAYDAKGRRIQKIVATNNGTAYVGQYTNKFLYDGWNLIAETKPNNALIRSYVWGTDLSGSLRLAGGVGGLLEISYYDSSTTNCFPAFDGNGNVVALFNAADGTSLANYAYGPFGELIQQTGIMAKNNHLRFSTKYQDDESDLLYYGYRYYKPLTGTWPNRDPIGEFGGKNLYAFIANKPIIIVDVIGLCKLGEKSDVKCAHHVSTAVSNPDLDESKEGLVGLVGDIELADDVDAILEGGIAAGQGMEEVLAEVYKFLMDKGMSPDKEKLAQAANDLANQLDGKICGYTLYTRIDYKECVSSLCFFTKKLDKHTDWKEYQNGGEDLHGLFADIKSALKAADKACEENMKEFNSSQGVQQ